jgi:hypothetical protein
MCSPLGDSTAKERSLSGLLVHINLCEAVAVRIKRMLAAGTVGALASGGALLLPGPSGASTPSATTLYKDALATTKSWSVHYAAAGTDMGVTILESGDAGPASGTQEVLVGKGSLVDSASLVLIGGITYMKGNARALVDLTGLSATQAQANAGKWVQFATDNKAFAQVVVGVRSHDVADELALKGPYSLGTERQLDGVEVIPIRGTQHFQGLKPISAILYVRAKGKHVPVEEDTVTSTGKNNGVEHTIYSKWGETVRPVAPSASISIGPVGVT